MDAQGMHRACTNEVTTLPGLLLNVRNIHHKLTAAGGVWLRFRSKAFK